MPQDYTLKLNIRADAGQAVQEAKKLHDALNSGASGALGGGASATAKAVQATSAVSRASSAVSALGVAAKGVSFAFSAVKTAISGAWSLLKSFASFLSMPFKLAWSGVKTAMKGVAAVLGTIAAGAYGASKALNPAGKMETYQTQLEVLLKSPGAARRRLKELTRYAKETNFSPDEVIGAGNQLQAFGMYDFRTLRLAGDAANAFGKGIGDVVHSLAYLKSGRTGEAMESLGQFGVTRQKLAAQGVRFGNSGQMLTSPDKALQAVLRVFEGEYGGMTARIGKTWTGAKQQLGGEVFDAMARGMEKALAPATRFVTQSLIPAIEKFGNFLQSVAWDRLLQGPLGTGSAILAAAGNFADPRTRELGKAQFSDLWEGMKTVGDALLKGLVDILGGALKTLASTFSGFISGGGLKAVFEAGAATFKAAFSSFTPEFQMMLESILEKIPLLGYEGADTKAARGNLADAYGAVLSGGQPSGVGKGLSLSMKGFASKMSMFHFGETDPSRLDERSRQRLYDMTLDQFQKKYYDRYRPEYISGKRDAFSARQQADVSAAWSKAYGAFSAIGGAIDLDPLKEGLASASGRISGAWEGAMKPAVRRVNVSEAVRRNGGRWNYNAVRDFYGEETARKFANVAEMQKMSDAAILSEYGEASDVWQDYNLPSRQNARASRVWKEQAAILQEAERTRRAQAGKGGADSGRDAAERKRNEALLKEVKDLGKKIASIAKAIAPIATAYAGQ